MKKVAFFSIIYLWWSNRLISPFQEILPILLAMLRT